MDKALETGKYYKSIDAELVFKVVKVINPTDL